MTRPALCRYCKRFVGKTAKNGICRLCWQLAPVPQP